VLNAAETIQGVDRVGFNLQALKGGRERQWAMTRAGEMEDRVSVRNSEAFDVDLVDYH
jgi:hypothetical protein